MQRFGAMGVRVATQFPKDAGVIGESASLNWELSSDSRPLEVKSMMAGVFGEALAPVTSGKPLAIKPGAPCEGVDRAVRKYYEDHDLMQYWRHHVGHAIGLRYHEGPFLDVGDDTIIQPRMVFTVEPGLYAANLGGFRHSDTVVVTEDGIEIITFYPRDLESLTLPV